MKKLFLFSALVLTMTLALRAQDADTNGVQTQLQEEAHFTFFEGKLYQVKNQKRIQVKEKVVLADGTTVNPDGTVLLKNQEKLQLKQGEVLDAKGNQYKTQSAYQNQLKVQTQAKNGEYVVVEEGKAYKVQNQEKIQLQEKYMLKNGTAVNPDGSLELKNGKKVQLKEGQVVDGEGKKYKNQHKYQTKRESKVREQREEGRRGSGSDRMDRKMKSERSSRSGRR